MKIKKDLRLLGCALGLWASCIAQAADDAAAPPISSPPKYSAAELEKLVGPIALYPDPLIATILPASVFPVEIVQAARFVQDTNNIPNLDDQPWDENVKAISRVPAVIEMLNTNLAWTVDLGQAFLEQQDEVMDAIQNLRAKAQGLGNLKTTPEQVVVVTNMIIEKTVEQKVVYVTNTVVQIVPSNPQVIYVPTYHPYYVYYPPPPYYTGPPPIVTFAAGVTVGLILANNCNWYHRGIYVGPHGAVIWRGGSYHGHSSVKINVNKNVNINNSYRPPTTQYNSQSAASTMNQKWQPDQGRLNKSDRSGSASTAEARGWSSGEAGTRPATGGSQPSTPSATKQNVPSTQPARPASSAQPAQQPSSQPGQRPGSAQAAQRPGSGQPAQQPSSGGGPAPSTGSRASSGGSSSNRPGSSNSPDQSAFGNTNNGQSERGYGSRGSSSRGGSGRGGGAKSAGQR